ncbi:MAG: hypothetical protein JWM21_647 [Acidobacteria bacterium]|nr:hypothetical protein [Acidobacteriota bacterium]
MKCEVCIKLLEEYIDGELSGPEAESLSAHLITCTACAQEFEALTSEQEMYSRYDRTLAIAPSMWGDMWGDIASRTTKTSRVIDSGLRFRLREWFVLPSFAWSFAGAMAILIFAVLMGVVYLRPNRQPAQQVTTAGAARTVVTAPRDGAAQKAPAPVSKPQELVAERLATESQSKIKAAAVSKTLRTSRTSQSRKSTLADQSDVLFSNAAFSAVEDRDTQRHIEQAQNLLRSIRNIEVSDNDEIDVSFEKALSRRLLDENVVLRRDAEMSGNFPTKMLLSDLEPFLIDIANLPGKAAPEDLRVLKERVLKTEIVAALQGY